MELDYINEYVLLAIVIVLIAPVNSSSLEMSIFSCIFTVFFVFTFFSPSMSFGFGQIEVDVYFHPGYNWKTTFTFVWGLTCVCYIIVIHPSLGNLLDIWLNQIESYKIG